MSWSGWTIIYRIDVSLGDYILYICAFVRDIGTNHLPHIYAALHAIARKQGIDPEELPLVRFVELHGHRHRD